MNVGRWIAVLVACWLVQACVSGPTNPNAQRPASNQDAAIANLNLGAGYVRQGRPDLAVESLQRALDLNPRLVDAHSTIAIAYDQLGQAAEAEQHYRRAATLDPASAAAANSYAVFLCRQDRWRDAESYFRRAADSPRYATPEVALSNAGVCAGSVGDNEKAEQYFRAALAKKPDFPDALSSMLDLSYREQNYLQARAFMQRYLDVRPANASVLWMCFNIEQELDNPTAANRCAAQLRERFPESAELAELQEWLRRDGRE